MTTTNLEWTDLEDAVVDRLEEDSLLEGRTFAVTSPFMDVDELPVPPIVVLGVQAEELSEERQAIGVPIVLKFTVHLNVVVVASWLRARGDAAGAHEFLAKIKDLLMGWQPELDAVKRPFTLSTSSLYDLDEERRLFFWMSEWTSTVLVREPQ